MKHYTFIAQFGGRHEDLSHPENSCRPRAKPEGDLNFLGGTNLRVSRLTGQLIVYYTESCSTTLYSAERCAVRHDRETRRLGGKHDDLFSLHVTFLDQSYFFIRHINYMRYNNSKYLSIMVMTLSLAQNRTFFAPTLEYEAIRFCPIRIWQKK